MELNFTRIGNDVNGNPRYVISMYKLLTRAEIENADLRPSELYNIAVKRAHEIGGKRYNTRHFQDCIVFQSYNVRQTGQDIIDAVKASV